MVQKYIFERVLVKEPYKDGNNPRFKIDAEDITKFKYGRRVIINLIYTSALL